MLIPGHRTSTRCFFIPLSSESHLIVRFFSRPLGALKTLDWQHLWDHNTKTF